MAVTVRGWKEEDLETVRRITWTTWVDAYGSFIPELDLKQYFDTMYTVEELRKLYLSPHFRGLLAEVDSVPSGYAKVRYVPEEKRCYVSSLYVLPDCQGKGVGKALLTEAEHYAIAFGVNEIWLGVMVQNAHALEWYQRIGFTFVIEEPFTMGSTSVPHRIGHRPIHQ
jgi:ribosomal protein S18 acetylase RimI-like enzyme